jgi:hypothetical protein
MRERLSLRMKSSYVKINTDTSSAFYNTQILLIKYVNWFL